MDVEGNCLEPNKKKWENEERESSGRKREDKKWGVKEGNRVYLDVRREEA